MVITNSFFEYAGIDSKPYHLKLLNLNTSSYDSCVGNIEPTSFYSKKEAKRYSIDLDYTNSPIEFDIDIISPSPIPPDQVRKIEKWLFNQRKYAKLYFDKDEDTCETVNGVTRRTYLNCRFKNPSKIEYGNMYGWSCTLECDSLMAWQDPTNSSFALSGSTSGSTIIDVEVDTDYNDFVYPYVTITTGSSGGDITISNHSDDTARLTSFSNLSANITFNMNGGINYVSGGNYEKFVDRNFIRLLDGTNSISIMGNVVEIAFKWQNMRYL